MQSLFDELIGVDALALALVCAPATIEEHARIGDLPGIKIGRSWIFPRAALLEALNRKAVEEAADRQNQHGSPVAVAINRRRRNVPPVLPTFSTRKD